MRTKQDIWRMDATTQELTNNKLRLACTFNTSFFHAIRVGQTGNNMGSNMWVTGHSAKAGKAVQQNQNKLNISTGGTSCSAPKETNSTVKVKRGRRWRSCLEAHTPPFGVKAQPEKSKPNQKPKAKHTFLLPKSNRKNWRAGTSGTAKHSRRLFKSGPPNREANPRVAKPNLLGLRPRKKSPATTPEGRKPNTPNRQGGSIWFPGKLLDDGLAPVLLLVDDPRQGHRQEHVLHLA